MKNFPIEHKGKIYWISRAVAVIGFVLKKIDNKWCILINQRGEGVPDYVGFYNIPCGYLDFDESHQEATSREVYEETGFNVEPNKWSFIRVQSDPQSNKQNVTLCSYYIASKFEDYSGIKQGGEKDEVSDIKWIEISKINTISKWAFEHDKLIKEIFKQIKKEKPNLF